MGRRWAPIAVALLLGCGGCGDGVRVAPDTLYISMESSTGSANRPELGNNRLIGQRLFEKFRALHPGVAVHVSHYTADELVAATRFRDSRGLGPDLMVSRVVTALQLHRQGLSSTLPVKPEAFEGPQPRFSASFREGSGVFAVPFLAQPQVACYDRRRVSDPPKTLDQLLALSAKGLRVGLPLTTGELFWTTTAPGASDAVSHWLEGPAKGKTHALPAADRQAFERWMAWVHNASLQKNVSFADDPFDLVRQLQRGERDWISCASLWIDGLEKRLGSNLGVSVLPGGANTPATPISRLLVWSFGRNSSARQRELAKQFVAFTRNEVVQKQLMDSVPGNLPVNPDVLIPSRTSSLMAALAFSLEHSRLLVYRDPDGAVRRGQQMEAVLKKMVQGEWLPSEATDRLLGAKR